MCIHMFLYKIYLHDLDIGNVYRVITLMTYSLRKIYFVFHLRNETL